MTVCISFFRNEALQKHLITSRLHERRSWQDFKYILSSLWPPCTWRRYSMHVLTLAWNLASEPFETTLKLVLGGRCNFELRDLLQEEDCSLFDTPLTICKQEERSAKIAYIKFSVCIMIASIKFFTSTSKLNKVFQQLGLYWSAKYFVGHN